MNSKKLIYHIREEQKAYVFDLEAGKEYLISEKMKRMAFCGGLSGNEEPFFIYQLENGEWVLLDGNTMQFYTFPNLNAENVSLIHGSKKERALVLEIRENDQAKLVKWTWEE